MAQNGTEVLDVLVLGRREVGASADRADLEEPPLFALATQFAHDTRCPTHGVLPDPRDESLPHLPVPHELPLMMAVRRDRGDLTADLGGLSTQLVNFSCLPILWQ